ncbi:hypothetical protein FNF31_07165 [Cafeteria roenbergensis]|uniref:Reverse transcriptase domain-containing protein n=1 Tax=Cafeteria roenbergensis TaxID=33653 RepID=A0A5A8CAD6_CAFRO|nr:hypothetical protein FNF31_07165 [Cafeteria roenbergensis]
MVQDNSASAAPAALRGVNSRVDTSFLEFPKVPSAAELCQLIADMEDKHSGPLFLAPMDIQAAYRQLSAGAGATPLLTIASGKVTLMNVALPMGARFSASALCAATAALGDALRTDHTGVAVYADDILLVSACDEAGARADRDRAAELCGQLGLPVAVEKCPPPAHVADYVGLRFSSRSDLTLVSVKPSTLQKLLGALDSVRAGGRISVSVHEPMLGRAYWLSCLCLPIKAWIRRLAQEIVRRHVRLVAGFAGQAELRALRRPCPGCSTDLPQCGSGTWRTEPAGPTLGRSICLPQTPVGKRAERC